jgi:hypothetical protein
MIDQYREQQDNAGKFAHRQRLEPGCSKSTLVPEKNDMRGLKLLLQVADMVVVAVG